MYYAAMHQGMVFDSGAVVRVLAIYYFNRHECIATIGSALLIEDKLISPSHIISIGVDRH